MMCPFPRGVVALQAVRTGFRSYAPSGGEKPLAGRAGATDTEP
jgi:hypothetical protein